MAKKKAKKEIEDAGIVLRFGARLRELRNSRSLTQAELARQAHVTASYAWRLEGGGAAPCIDLLDRLAAALGTTAADLLSVTAREGTTVSAQAGRTEIRGFRWSGTRCAATSTETEIVASWQPSEIVK